MQQGGLDVNSTTNLRNSIIFNNTVLDGTVNNCDAAVNNQGNNWIDVNGACGTLNTVTAANLKLSTTLAINTSAPANTGPTQTLALDTTSSVNGVIPAGTDCGAGTGATDQRGVARAAGAGCEPGAYEVQSSAVTGTVFGDTNRNGTQETGENAFTAATVTVTLTNTATNAALTTTTTTGSYTFSNVSPGTYNVTAAASGYVVTTAARTVTVASGTSSTVQATGLAQNPAPTACSVLYAGGITRDSNNNLVGGPIFSVNTATGARIADLFTAPYATAAFARHPVNGRIYFIENSTGTTARLGYYDPTTNTLTPAAATINKGTDTGNFTRFGFNASGVGYASVSANNAVYTITPSGNTATVARLGTISSSLPVNLSGDFAITAANRAWLSANGVLYRIDLNKPDLPAVVIYNSNNANVNGVAFDTNSDILISDTAQLYRVNPGTLQQTTTSSTFNTTTSAPT